MTVQTNTYDGNGRRVEAVQGGQTNVYIYEGTNLIYEENTNSSAVDKYYYANGLLLQEACECGYSYYYLNDALGSVRHVMQSANLLYSSDYRPFGLNYQKDGQFYFQFSGKPIDGATGLYYFGARYYNLKLQRFMTEDTFPGVKEDPQSLNRYSYVENNPLSRTDPTGNCDAVYGCSSSSSSSSSSSTGVGLPIYAGGGTTGYAQGTGGGETSPPPAPPAPPPTCLYSCQSTSTSGGGSSASSNGAGQSSPATTSDTSTSARPPKLWNPIQTDPYYGEGQQCSLRPAICPGQIHPLNFTPQEINTFEAWAVYAEVQSQAATDVATGIATRNLGVGLRGALEQVRAGQVLAYLLRAGWNADPGTALAIAYGATDTSSYGETGNGVGLY